MAVGEEATRVTAKIKTANRFTTISASKDGILKIRLVASLAKGNNRMVRFSEISAQELTKVPVVARNSASHLLTHPVC